MGLGFWVLGFLVLGFGLRALGLHSTAPSKNTGELLRNPCKAGLETICSPIKPLPEPGSASWAPSKQCGPLEGLVFWASGFRF